MKLLTYSDTLFLTRCRIVNAQILLAFSSSIDLLLVFLEGGQFRLGFLQRVEFVDLEADHLLSGVVHGGAHVILSVVLDLVMEKFVRVDLLGTVSVDF